MAGNLSRCHCLHGPSFCCNVGFLFCFFRSLSNRKYYDELCILHRPIHSPVCGWLRPPVVCEPDVYFYNSLMKNEIFVYVWSYNTYIFVIYILYLFPSLHTLFTPKSVTVCCTNVVLMVPQRISYTLPSVQFTKNSITCTLNCRIYNTFLSVSLLRHLSQHHILNKLLRLKFCD